MATEFMPIQSSEAAVLPYPPRFAESAPAGNWEALAHDALADQVSAGYSLSILACREYDENGPSGA